MRDSFRRYDYDDMISGIILWVLGIAGLILLFGLLFIVVAGCINIYYGV